MSEADSVKDEFKKVIETSIHELWEPMHQKMKEFTKQIKNLEDENQTIYAILRQNGLLIDLGTVSSQAKINLRDHNVTHSIFQFPAIQENNKNTSLNPKYSPVLRKKTKQNSLDRPSMLFQSYDQQTSDGKRRISDIQSNIASMGESLDTSL